MPSQEEIAQAALAEMRSRMTQQLAPERKPNERDVVERPTALDFEKTERLKRLVLQNVKENPRATYTKYTKSLVKQYLSNPYNYRTQIIGISRFLWVVSTLYRKIILYYATMPLYNYNIIERPDFTKTNNAKKMLKDYEEVLRRCHKFNFKNEFATAIALAIRDGVYYGFMYDNGEDGSFLHMLPVEYCKI